MGRGLSIDTLMAEEGTFTLGAYRRQAPLPPESPSKPPRVRVSLPVAPDSSWRLQAACLDHDPQLWVKPPDGGVEAEAVCRRCPVHSDCLGWARSMPIHEREGMVLGGHLWDSKGRPYKRLPLKACRICGEEFQPLRKSDRYCSKLCGLDAENIAARAKRPSRPDGHCLHCGVAINQPRSGTLRKYCSNACRCRDYYADNRLQEIERKRRERAS